MSIEKVIAQDFRDKENIEARKWLKEFVQKEQLVGELLSINYEKAKVIIHDHARRQVGGIPSLGFLLATRVDPDQDSIDYKNEDTSLILLRVMDSTPLPNHSEAENIRFGTAQRVSGETDKHWDEDGIMDAKTRVYLGYSGVECRIIGTFYFDKEHRNEQLSIKFGGDISNYYPNRGLKIYKPKGKALIFPRNSGHITKQLVEPQTLQGLNSRSLNEGVDDYNTHRCIQTHVF